MTPQSKIDNLLVDHAQERLAHEMHSVEARDFVAPLRALQNDDTFWANQCDGLAVFLPNDFLRVYRLPWQFRDEAEVGHVFSVTPLLPLLSGDGRFYVLALSQNMVRLFQGTRQTLTPVDLKRAPHNLTEAMLTHDRDEVLMFHTQPTSGGSWGAIFHGQGVGIDDKKDDLLRYFRSIDRGLHDVLRDERGPLVVAGVDYYLPIYRQANTYPHLLGTGIEGCPDRLSEKQLHDRAWAIVEPHFQKNLQRAVDLFRQYHGTGRATTDVSQIILAASREEIETLFVTQDRQLWGVLDPGRSEVTFHDPQEPGDEDLLNLAAIHTLRHGNTVYSLPSHNMPTAELLAAVYHLPMGKHGPVSESSESGRPPLHAVE